MISFQKTLLLTLILFACVIGGSLLIWQGLNLDNPTTQPSSEPRVLGNQVETVASPSAQVVPSLDENKFAVVKVFDGDTFQIEINGQKVSVRMIGIDTPETIDPRRPVGCFGKKSSDETKRLLVGKVVTLTKDISDTDKYNRLLRYVFLPISGGESLFVNDYLVRQGFAKALTYPPDVKYNERFLEAEREARENLRGLWGECK